MSEGSKYYNTYEADVAMEKKTVEEQIRAIGN